MWTWWRCARRARASSALRVRRRARTASAAWRVHSWMALCLSRPHLGDGFDRVNDRLVTSTPAVIAGNVFADHITARHPAARQKFLRTDQHAGGAEAALQRVAAPKRILQVGNNTGIGQTLDRLHVGAIALHRKEKAAAHHGVVDKHRAGAADALFAADMRPGQSKVVAQEIHQRLAGFDAFANVFAVDAQLDVEKSLSHRPKTRDFDSAHSRASGNPVVRKEPGSPPSQGRVEYKTESNQETPQSGSLRDDIAHDIDGAAQ